MINKNLTVLQIMIYVGLKECSNSKHDVQHNVKMLKIPFNFFLLCWGASCGNAWRTNRVWFTNSPAPNVVICCAFLNLVNLNTNIKMTKKINKGDSRPDHSLCLKLRKQNSQKEIAFFQEQLSATNEYVNLFTRKDIIAYLSGTEFLETIYIISALEETIASFIRYWQNSLSEFEVISQVNSGLMENKNSDKKQVILDFDISLIPALFKEIHAIKKQFNISPKTLKDFHKHIEAVNKFVGGYNHE